MSESNKYEDMSVLTALKYAKDGNLLLPDIQREYVWDVSEIECLFESIIDEYPVGSYIFWKTNKKSINENKLNLYYFIRNFKSGVTKNEKAPEIIQEEKDYYIVLDGQQRITSLNIALNGSYKVYKGGKGHNRSNSNSFVEKELYYNLGYYDEHEKDDEIPIKRFIFLTTEEASVGKFYKIKNLLQYDKLGDFLVDLINSKVSKKCRDDLEILFNRLSTTNNNGLIHYYCISKNTYDEALDIFVRVNSTGRKLSKSDLLFSTLINGWDNGKERIDDLIASMNSMGDKFSFNRDYLMRCCLVLVDADTNLKIKSLTNDTIQKIRDNWGKIKTSLEEMVKIMVSIGISDETLTSYNATMPIAYYIYKEGKIKDSDSKKETRKFLSVSLAKRLFGVASNSALNSTRNELKQINCKNTKFSLSLFANVKLVGNRTFNVDENDIDFWLNNYEKGQNTFILLSLLYPNLKLSQVSFHQDHCHPYAGFEKKAISSLNLSNDKVKEWQKKRNLLPNLQFLEGTENESKNKTPLKEWVSNGNDFEYHPDNVSLELKDFDTFFEERRKLIKNKLMELFDVPVKVQTNDATTTVE